jgi:putative ABC transport system permease protein
MAGFSFGSILQDLRYGARELRKNPTFTITAGLSLAFGIMAATAMYSVIYGVVLDPFPYKDIDNLVSIAIRNPEQRGWRTSYSVDEYVELSRRSTIFEGIAASTISDVVWSTQGETRSLRGNHISNNGFDVMGVPALHGRAVTARDEDPETKAILGYQFWIRQFAGDPSVVGSTLTLNGRPRTIVGIMPPRFMFRGADVYVPLDYAKAGPNPEGVNSMILTARRKAGVTAAQATTDIDPIVRDMAQKMPARYPPTWKIELITFKDTFPTSWANTLWILFGAVGLLLLISCANVSNLLLARASARQSEISMRAALGASRGRLFRQLLTESLLLGIGGGVLGMAGSWAVIRMILAVVPSDLFPAEAEVTLNLPVMFFNGIICLLTTMLFSLAPALHGSVGDAGCTLKEAGRGVGSSRKMNWLRSGLVVGEISLAIALLSIAGLFLHTLQRLHSTELVVGTADRLVVTIPLPQDRYSNSEQRTSFLSQLIDRVERLPGVRAVGLNAGLHPFGSWDFPIEIPSATTAVDKRPVHVHQVNIGYLKLTGIPLLQGRWLDSADIAAGHRVVVINEEFAKRYFGGQSGQGKAIRMPRMKQPPFNIANDSFEVVGLVRNGLSEFDFGQPRPEMYIPYSVTGLAETMVIHSGLGQPRQLANQVSRQLYELDPTLALGETEMLEAMIDRFVYSRGRFQLWLMGSFAALGLAISVVGVYGLLSQFVLAQGTDFGVRMAVGATFQDIVALVLTRGMRLVVIGLAIGCAATYVLLMRYGNILAVKDPLDPVALAGSCLVLLAAGALACLVPAVRAGRTDPAVVLRR